MTEERRLVLVGMSVREAVSDRGVARMAVQAGGTCAYLQLGEPSVSAELTRLAEEGVDRITLVGVSLGAPSPGVSWLRRIAGFWWRNRPEPRPHIDVATALVGEGALVAAAAADVRPILGSEAPLRSRAWEDVPRHRHHLLVCRGPRCTATGSDRSAEAFVLAMMREGLDDDDVLITHTGCQFPCNQAPVVSVQPDDVWYGGVDVEVATTIVTEHLVSDRPVETHRLPRERRGPRSGPDRRLP